MVLVTCQLRNISAQRPCVVYFSMVMVAILEGKIVAIESILMEAALAITIEKVNNARPLYIVLVQGVRNDAACKGHPLLKWDIANLWWDISIRNSCLVVWSFVSFWEL